MNAFVLGRHLRSVWSDPCAGLERLVGAGGGRAFVRIFAGLFTGWWIYVPLHELLHAAGCLLAGGTVSRLEIDAFYGGALLAAVFPFVHPASEYAGRLSGFDTGGSDLVYLVTDLFPYLLTLWPGLWAVRRAGRRGQAVWFGFFLPWGLAPLISLPGDAFEIGALCVRQLPPWNRAPVRELLLSDDLFAKAGELAGLGGAPWGGFAMAAATGAVWAFGTVALASWAAACLGETPLSDPPPLAAGNEG